MHFIQLGYQIFILSCFVLIYLVKNYLLSTCSILVSVLGIENKIVNEKDTVSNLKGFENSQKSNKNLKICTNNVHAGINGLRNELVLLIS